MGSTSLTVDSNGAKISELRYSAWGEVRYQAGTSPTKYTYTGQYDNTADFGLMYYNARWYDPSLGRFAQADSIVPAGVQGYDRYAYVNNNPVKYTDPSGHMAVEDSDGIGCPTQDLACQLAGSGYQQDKEAIEDMKNNVVETLTNAAILLDHISMGLSVFEAGIADFLMFGIITSSKGVAIREALYADIIIAGPLNPLANIENNLGLASIGMTAAADILSGNQPVIKDGQLWIGKDTFISARNTVMGFAPESNFDAVVSASQVKYDMDRINGVKSGGMINISNMSLKQFLWQESPLQDLYNGFR